VKVCIVAELHAFPIGGLIAASTKRKLPVYQMRYLGDFLIERQAGPVYDGPVSRVKRKSFLAIGYNAGGLVRRFAAEGLVVMDLARVKWCVPRLQEQD
jgi:hypothetical protein